MKAHVCLAIYLQSCREVKILCGVAKEAAAITHDTVSKQDAAPQQSIRYTDTCCQLVRIRANDELHNVACRTKVQHGKSIPPYSKARGQPCRRS